jgi:tetratricopeptide (TPR) repeat protein
VLNAALTPAWAEHGMHARRDGYEEGLRLSAAGRHGEAIAQLELALASRPNDPRILFALGNTARDLGLPAPAEQFYRMVLALEPGRLEALVNLANLLRAGGNPQGALALLAPALSREPDSAQVWLALGAAHRELGDCGAAEAHYREALALRPDYVAALVNLADLRSDAGAGDEALSLYNRALAIEPGNAKPRFHRALLHLERGDLAQGWRDYEARLSVDPIVHDHRLRRWSGERLNGKALLVTAEQGVGDELMFASAIPDLAARQRIVLECDKRLVSLFARSFAGVRVRASSIQKTGAATQAHHDGLYDSGAAIEIGSLPLHLRATRADFPKPHAYLIADANEKARWTQAFAGTPHIGICWRSGKRTNGRAMNYAPPEAWAGFIRDLPGTIVSVQYDANAEEIAELESLSGRKILVPEAIDQKNELDRACAMLSALDCVVSAPTAVSWLASGAGVPVCKILYRRGWTSFGTDHEPFAPSCLCASPARDGDWADAFAKASAAIRAQTLRA